MLTGIRVCKSAKECSGFKERIGEAISPHVLEIEKLYYKGCSDRKIARTLGISRYSVYTWRNSQGLEAIGDEQRGRPKKG